MGFFSSLFKTKETKEPQQQVYEKSSEDLYHEAEDYEMGKGVEQSFKKAFELYKKASDMGNLKATNVLGIFYKCGYYVEKDLEESFFYTKVAAEGGYPPAMNNLAAKYEKGSGCEKSIAKSIEWYKKAQENGRERANYKLGAIYEGMGDYSSAYEAYKNGIRQFDNDDCKIRYGRLEILDLVQGSDKKNAFEMIQEVADKGNVEAYKVLGECYEYTESYKDAWDWYHKVLINGDISVISDIDRIKDKYKEPKNNNSKNDVFSEQREHEEFWEEITNQFTPAENNKLKKIVLEYMEKGEICEDTKERLKVLCYVLGIKKRYTVKELLENGIYPKYSDYVIYKDTSLETPDEFFSRLDLLELKEDKDKDLVKKIGLCVSKERKPDEALISDLKENMQSVMNKLSEDDAEYLTKHIEKLLDEYEPLKENEEYSEFFELCKEIELMYYSFINNNVDDIDVNVIVKRRQELMPLRQLLVCEEKGEVCLLKDGSVVDEDYDETLRILQQYGSIFYNRKVQEICACYPYIFAIDCDGNAICDVDENVNLDDSDYADGYYFGYWDDFAKDQYGNICDYCTNLRHMCAGDNFMAMLKNDGTVKIFITDPDSDPVDYDISEWKNICEIYADKSILMALDDDGNAYVCGITMQLSEEEMEEVGSWTEIKQIVKVRYYFVGLKYDGTVVSTKKSEDGSIIDTWRDIDSICVLGDGCLCAVTKEGRVLVSEEYLEGVYSTNSGEHFGFNPDLSRLRNILYVISGDEFSCAIDIDGNMILWGDISMALNTDLTECIVACAKNDRIIWVDHEGEIQRLLLLENDVSYNFYYSKLEGFGKILPEIEERLKA